LNHYDNLFDLSVPPLTLEQDFFLPIITGAAYSGACVVKYALGP